MVNIILRHNARFSVLILTRLIQTTFYVQNGKDYALNVYLYLYFVAFTVEMQ